MYSSVYLDESDVFPSQEDGKNAKLPKQEPADEDGWQDPLDRLQVHVIQDGALSIDEEYSNETDKNGTPSPVPSDPDQIVLPSNVHLTKPILLPSYAKSFITNCGSHNEVNPISMTSFQPPPPKKFRRLYSDNTAKHSPNHIMSWYDIFFFIM